MSTSSFFEIVELASGEVVLRRVDSDSESLVKIQFSEEARLYLGDATAEVGKAMIGTGLQMVGKMYEQSAEEYEEAHVIH